MEFLIIWSVLGLVGVLIAQSKNTSPIAGCLWGLFLGPIGWLIVAVGQANEPKRSPTGRPLRKCPFCAEMILVEASVCRYCGRDIQPGEQPAEQNQKLSQLHQKQSDMVERFRREAKQSKGSLPTIAPWWPDYKCPACRKRIPMVETSCEYCGHEILPSSEPLEEIIRKNICPLCGKIVSRSDGLTVIEGMSHHSVCVEMAAPPERED